MLSFYQENLAKETVQRGSSASRQMTVRRMSLFAQFQLDVFLK
jgi:hypothetical protein